MSAHDRHTGLKNLNFDKDFYHKEAFQNHFEKKCFLKAPLCGLSGEKKDLLS